MQRLSHECSENFADLQRENEDKSQEKNLKSKFKRVKQAQVGFLGLLALRLSFPWSRQEREGVDEELLLSMKAVIDVITGQEPATWNGK